MTVSWIHVDLVRTVTWPSKQSWSYYVNDDEPMLVWRAAEGDGADKEYAPLDRYIFDFKVSIPQYTPQTMQFCKHGSIKYRLVATMAAKVRRGIFRVQDVSITVETSCPINIIKYEYLSCWPAGRRTHDEEVESRSLLFKVLWRHNDYAVGETIPVRAIVHNKNYVPREIKGIKILLLQEIEYSDGFEMTNERRVIGTEMHSIDEELPSGEVGMYDVDISVPEGTLENLSGYGHIDIWHPVVVELYTDVGKLVVLETRVFITRFSIMESVLLMHHIGDDRDLSY